MESRIINMKQLIKIALLCLFPLMSIAQTPAYQKNPRSLRVTDNGQIYKWKDSIYYKGELALKAEGFYQIPNGKNVVDFMVDGKQARVTTSNDYSISGDPKRLAIFFHFYGGTYASVPSGKLRDSLLNNGYSIASISTGESWGNEQAQQLYVSLYNHVVKKFNVQKQPIAVSVSMGSLAALNVINRNLIPFKSLINTIGVINLGEYYGRAMGVQAGVDIRKAYNFTNSADSTKAFFGFNPYTRLNTTYGDTTFKISVPVYFINGEIDTSVPLKFTKQIQTGLNRTYSNSVLDIVPGVGHDTSIVTSAIAAKIMLWLKSNPLTNYNSPDTAIALKTKNGIQMTDKLNLPYQSNFIDFYKANRERRGLFGFGSPSTMGDDGMIWVNNNGSIGIFSEKLSHEISLGVFNSSTAILTKNFTLTDAGLNIKLPTTIDASLRSRGGVRVERVSVPLQYTNIDHEAGATTILSKNGASAGFSTIFFSQGNNASNREVGKFDGSGNFVITGKTTIANPPLNPTDALRLTDLGTGWAQYTDNVYTSGSPLIVNASTTATITNNSATSIESQLPIGVSSFYNSGTSKITPELDGDSYLINVRFTAESSSVTGLCDVGIDIGGAMNIISQETVSLRKGVGNSQRVNIVFDVFSGSTFLSNGGLIKLTSIDGNTSIYDISYKITRTHKAK